MWKTNAAATPANLRKRTLAAMEALESALAMSDRRPDDKAERALAAALRNAMLWTRDAHRKAGGSLSTPAPASKRAAR